MFLELHALTWALVVVAILIVATDFVRRTKRDGLPRYKPATPGQKVACIVGLVVILAVWTIYFAGWGLFGGYEKQVALGVGTICSLYVVRLTTMLELP